jgi:hypothetical protein
MKKTCAAFEATDAAQKNRPYSKMVLPSHVTEAPVCVGLLVGAHTQNCQNDADSLKLEDLLVRIEKVKGSCQCEPCFASVEMNLNLNTWFGKSPDRLLLQNSQRLITES